MYMKTDDLLDEIFIVKNHGEKTKKIYIRAINHYSKFHNLSMEELIEEAELEESKGIKWKNRKLKKRLLKFRHHLIENYKKNTVTTYFTPIIAVYKYFEIEIGELTKPNPRSFNTPGEVTFDELITHEEIAQVLHVAKLWFQAVLLFMTSSGCARKETAAMTIGQFKKATYSYHRKDNILEILEVLKKTEDIIPTFKLKRQKTNKHYYTFCSPEATNKIVEYLLTERVEKTEDGQIKLINLDDDDKLFDVEENYYPVAFYRYNDLFDFGIASDGFNRFRSHMMRKFHSNNLEYDGMSESDVDRLQGRGKSSTRSAYFMDNPEILRKKYIEHLPCLLIEMNVNKMDYKSPEYVQLETENVELKEENKKYLEVVENIDERIERKIQEAIDSSSKKLSDEEFEDLFS